MCRQNVERMEGGEENEQRELKSPYIPSLSLLLTIATFLQRGKEEESLCRERLRRIVDKIPYIVLFELIAAE